MLPKQRELAFFSLQPDITDPGFIQLRFDIKGPLDQDIFTKSWKQLALRHESLRMSLQSPKQKQSMLVVTKDCELPVTWLDIRSKSSQEQQRYLESLEADIAADGLDLSTPSVNRLVGVQTNESQISFFWACHHLLLDGWSAIILLNELAQIYSNKSADTQLPAAVQSTHSDYLGWLSSRSDDDAAAFWSETLQDFTSPTAISNCFSRQPAQQGTKPSEKPTSKNDNRIFELFAKPELNKAIEKLAAEHKTTSASVVYAAWAVYLAALAKTDDVVFGTSTAGRMFDLPDSQKMTGYFSNVIPLRVKPGKTMSFIDLLLQINQAAFSSLEYEYTPLEKIQACSEIPQHQRLFDHLVLFENLPLDDIELSDSNGGVSIGNFSGNQTTRYPFTLTIRPGDEWRFRIIHQPDLDSELLHQALIRFPELLLAVCSNPTTNIDKHINAIANQLASVPLLQSKPLSEVNTTIGVQLARNQTELAVAAIWEDLLGITGIDVNSEFIALGGRSVVAVRMLARIENELGVKLSMRDMVQDPTISAIAKLIDGDDQKAPWTSLIPLKPAGRLEPVIFVNGARGHALFIRSVTKYFDKERPVIGMQLVGLDGERPPMETVDEIVDHFLQEILTYQPSGPYYLVAHCFGVAIVHEMVQRLEQRGEKVVLVVALDASPPHAERGTTKYQKTLRIARQGQGINPSHYASLAVRIVKNINYQFRMLAFNLRRRSKLLFGSAFEKSEIRLDLAYEACTKASHTYVAKPIDNKVILISSSDNPEPMYEEWRGMTSELEIIKLPVRHNWMFTEPEVASLGKTLSDLVENAGNRSTADEIVADELQQSDTVSA